MAYEIVMTVLLLLLAVLGGAFIACLLRRWMGPPLSETDNARVEKTEIPVSNPSFPDPARAIDATAPMQAGDRNAEFRTTAPENLSAVEPETRTSESVKPVQARGLKAPIGGHADDLKIISGVGPKLEKTLNELGIFHVQQIAVWTTVDMREVDDLLTFKGRIEREDWIAQAKKLLEE